LTLKKDFHLISQLAGLHKPATYSKSELVSTVSIGGRAPVTDRDVATASLLEICIDEAERRA
jgi:hypothetical protein